MYTKESTFVKFDHISFQCLVLKLLIQELALSLFDIITKSPEHKVKMQISIWTATKVVDSSVAGKSPNGRCKKKPQQHSFE